MRPLVDIFGPDGPLQRALPDFTLRRQQLHMAERVLEALESREALVIEAGTGIGKTFAYLVPALLSRARILISTGTRTLQDQLYAKDLPLVSGALGRPARVAMLKGRSNYLCRHRLEHARASAAGSPGFPAGPAPRSLAPAAPQANRSAVRDAVTGGWLDRIERWSRITRTGDLAEVPGLTDAHPLWSEVTSTRDNCLGVRCAELARCHVAAARRQAQEADIVIVNHHLLLADLVLKEDGFGDLLGSADAVVLDEAHQLPDLATQFFGAAVSDKRVAYVLEAIRQELAQARLAADVRVPDAAALEFAVRTAEDAARELASGLPRTPGRIAWEACGATLQRASIELAEALQALADELGSAVESTAATDSAAGERESGVLAALAERAAALGAQVERIASEDDEGLRSVEVTARGFTLHLLPFDIADRFRALLEARRCAWIFTSATLAVGEDFGHFTTRLGLGEAPTVKIGSPFDYERQSLLYLPGGLPAPASPGYLREMLAAMLPLIEASRGGAFVLFTSHRALAQGTAILRELWGESPPYRLYVQREAPREQLLQEFRADGDGVLLGTASFWEGVDVKGAALRLVIIEKLPFASPDDPLVKARIGHIESAGGNPFRDFQLPEAALALKQGVGRLIRSESDHGAVVICDRRIVERAYGRVLLSALPEMRCTQDEAEVLRFLRLHAPRPSSGSGSTGGRGPAGGAGGRSSSDGDSTGTQRRGSSALSP